MSDKSHHTYCHCQSVSPSPFWRPCPFQTMKQDAQPTTSAPNLPSRPTSSAAAPPTSAQIPWPLSLWQHKSVQIRAATYHSCLNKCDSDTQCNILIISKSSRHAVIWYVLHIVWRFLTFLPCVVAHISAYIHNPSLIHCECILVYLIQIPNMFVFSLDISIPKPPVEAGKPNAKPTKSAQKIIVPTTSSTAWYVHSTVMQYYYWLFDLGSNFFTVDYIKTNSITVAELRLCGTNYNIDRRVHLVSSSIYHELDIALFSCSRFEQKYESLKKVPNVASTVHGVLSIDDFFWYVVFQQ